MTRVFYLRIPDFRFWSCSTCWSFFRVWRFFWLFPAKPDVFFFVPGNPAPWFCQRPGHLREPEERETEGAGWRADADRPGLLGRRFHVHSEPNPKLFRKPSNKSPGLAGLGAGGRRRGGARRGLGGELSSRLAQGQPHKRSFYHSVGFKHGRSGLIEGGFPGKKSKKASIPTPQKGMVRKMTSIENGMGVSDSLPSYPFFYPEPGVRDSGGPVPLKGKWSQPAPPRTSASGGPSDDRRRARRQGLQRQGAAHRRRLSLRSSAFWAWGLRVGVAFEPLSHQP